MRICSPQSQTDSPFSPSAHLSQRRCRGYSEVDELSQAFRGRLRVADQMARTLPLPLEINYDDYTIDTQENRNILAATELLLRFPWIPDRARGMLLRIRAKLEGVQARLATLAEVPITRLNGKLRASPEARLPDHGGLLDFYEPREKPNPPRLSSI